MIIELVADGQHPLIGRAATIDNWIWQKLSRDLKSDRPTPVQVEDRNEFIEKINLVMMEAAAAMVTDDESVVSLLDSVSSDKIVQIYQRILKVDHLTLSSALAVSLLVPTVVRYRGTVPIRFTHRIFQEFYLARYLLQNGRSVDGYPDSVKGLFAELSMQ